MVFVAQAAQVLALLAFLIGVEARLLELVVGDGVLHAMHDKLDALLHLGELLGQGGLAQLDARAGFVDEVDSLVRQEAVGDISAGVGDGKIDGLLGVGDGVKFFVLVLDAVDDLDGILLAGRWNFDGLEAALERAVLLDGLAILGGCGCADALNFASAERGLEDIGGVERAFGRACADQGVQFVDEDDAVLVLHQLLHDGLQSLFKLAAILCSGDDEAEVEREDTLVGEEGRDFTVGDLLRQAFDDGGFTNSGLADEDGIVLGAAA